MKKKIFFILVLICVRAFAQENLRRTQPGIGRSSLFLTLGADNSNFLPMNSFFAANTYAAAYKEYGFSVGIGVTTNHTHINNGLYIDGSHQNLKYDQKSFRTQNYSVQYHVHYILSKNEKLFATVFSGLSMQTLNLRIDSIYDPKNIRTLGTIDLDKIFLNIPVGFELRHYFKKKNLPEGRNNRRQTSFFIGGRAVCYFRTWQSDWYTTFNNNIFPSAIQSRPYLQYSLVIGF